MYKILIADDEGIVRESLKYIIEKDIGNICELYFARSGRQAIELSELHKPEIAILDIQMPGINGLKALQEIKSESPNIRAIILTAYDNFNYAKDAIRLGAVDYIMKPLERGKITAILMRLIAELEEERKKRIAELEAREKLEAVIPIIENGFVQTLLIPDEYRYSGRQYRELLNIEEDYGSILVLECGENFSMQDTINPVGSGVRLRRYSMRIKGILHSAIHCFLSEINGNKLVLTIPTQNGRLDYEQRLELISRLRGICKELRELIEAECRIGIGSVKAWENIHESYSEAIYALRNGARSINHIDDIKSGLVLKGIKKEKIFLSELLSRGSDIELKVEAEAYLAAFSELPASNRKLRIIEFLVEAGGMLGDNEKPAFDSICTELLDADTGEELKAAFIQGLYYLAEALRIKENTSNTVIGRATAYIKENCLRDISLESTAQQVNISPYYFSKIFKDELGLSFSDYLTGLRMKSAEELMKTKPWLSIKEVAIETGYSDPNYFSRVYKRWTGMTPTELRDKSRNN